MATSTVGRTTIQGVTTVGGFNPLTLFTSGEQGVWYDPSDLSTMYQDSAGTIPITALEQPVGRINDKSGRGNNATQATSANRPVLSARVNLLTYTQDFSNAAWVAGNFGAVAAPTKGTTTALRPDGTSGTVDTITFPAVSASQGSFVYQNAGATLVNVALTGTVFARVTSGTATVYLNVEDIAAGPTGSNFIAGSAQTLTTTWQQISMSGTRTTSSGNAIFVIGFDTRCGAGQTNAGSLTIQVWGADLRVSNIGVGIPPYQRVGAATYGTSTAAGNADYDANGFPYYLSFDGTNDFLQTSTVNFNSTARLTTVMGARKLSDAAAGVIASTGDTTIIPGVFELIASGTNGVDRQCWDGRFSGGSVPQTVRQPRTYIAPITNVVSFEFNASATTIATQITPKVNGAAPSSIWDSATTTTTGTFVNSVLYIGARGGSSLPFNGNLYGLIVRGASSTSNQITGAENWLNQKTRAY